MEQIHLRKGNILQNTGTMAYRNLLKTIHNPERLMDVVVIPIVFMLMFSQLFGGAISGNVKSYLAIIVPGILMQGILSSAAGSGSQIREDLDTGVFDRFKSLPMANIAPLAGQLFADILRLIICTICSLGTGFLIGYRPEGGVGAVFLAAFLAIVSGWAISWIFALLGLVLTSTTLLQSFSMIVSMVMAFLSSAFVPINTLPKWLQTVANINPVTHMIAAIRSLLDKGIWGKEDWFCLIVCVGIVLIFAPLTVIAYNKKN
ncbi:MAG: ABC transporter permease [Lactobacillales bacterium]|jgi:ABC-2 type transport system permease protein|nr:ABC transporter permease [Lactobacillales bacterium]